MKKLVSIICALAICLGMVACGGKSELDTIMNKMVNAINSRDFDKYLECHSTSKREKIKDEYKNADDYFDYLRADKGSKISVKIASIEYDENKTEAKCKCIIETNIGDKAEIYEDTIEFKKKDETWVLDYEYRFMAALTSKKTLDFSYKLILPEGWQCDTNMDIDAYANEILYRKDTAIVVLTQEDNLVGSTINELYESWKQTEFKALSNVQFSRESEETIGRISAKKVRVEFTLLSKEHMSDCYFMLIGNKPVSFMFSAEKSKFYDYISEFDNICDEITLK